MKKTSIVIVLLCLLMSSSCDYFEKSSNEIVVAECYGKYLYKSELKGIVSEGMSTLDSIQRVNSFIDSWIRRQVLIHQAENNLNKEQLDLKKQLDEYRNSLVIYAYESQLIEQRLDTAVSKEEIEEYYEQNKEDFQLRNTMVRAAYIIIKEDCEHRDELKKMLNVPDSLLLQDIDMLANYDADKIHVDLDQWIRIEELTRIVPIEIFNTESFLKKNRFVCFDMNEFTYMVRFIDYLLEKSPSPLELVSDNIKSIILARRKQALLDKMEVDLYEKAKKEKAFEVYVGTPGL